MKFGILVLKFLFVGALFIVSNNGLHLAIGEERALFFDYFYSWLTNLFGHFADITGYVVGSEWLPNNLTVESP